MARPQRNNVDYFPFLCEDGNKMFYLEETYGNDGFSVFVKLLRELAKTDFHYLDLSKKPTIMFLSAKCKVDSNTLISIIKDLVELEKFDSELWSENSVVWCQDFIDSIQDAYAKRSNKCIDRNSLLLLLIGKGIRKQSKSTPKPSLCSSDSTVKPQRIVKDSIEEETIIKNIDLLYSLYPSKTTRDGKTCQTKSKEKNKKKLSTLLSKKEHTFESLKLSIESELNGKKLVNGVYEYLKNLEVFLGNLPDIDSVDVNPNKLDEDYVYYQWMNDPTVIARRIPKDLADQMFKNQAQASLIPTILTSLKGKKITWTQ